MVPNGMARVLAEDDEEEEGVQLSAASVRARVPASFWYDTAAWSVSLAALLAAMTTDQCPVGTE
jgi:hypothetical protein